MDEPQINTLASWNVDDYMGFFEANNPVDTQGDSVDTRTVFLLENGIKYDLDLLAKIGFFDDAYDYGESVGFTHMNHDSGLVLTVMNVGNVEKGQYGHDLARRASGHSGVLGILDHLDKQPAAYAEFSAGKISEQIKEPLCDAIRILNPYAVAQVKKL